MNPSWNHIRQGPVVYNNSGNQNAGNQPPMQIPQHGAPFMNQPHQQHDSFYNQNSFNHGNFQQTQQTAFGNQPHGFNNQHNFPNATGFSNNQFSNGFASPNMQVGLNNMSPHQAGPNMNMAQNNIYQNTMPQQNWSQANQYQYGLQQPMVSIYSVIGQFCLTSFYPSARGVL